MLVRHHMKMGYDPLAWTQVQATLPTLAAAAEASCCSCCVLASDSAAARIRLPRSSISLAFSIFWRFTCSLSPCTTVVISEDIAGTKTGNVSGQGNIIVQQYACIRRMCVAGPAAIVLVQHKVAQCIHRDDVLSNRCRLCNPCWARSNSSPAAGSCAISSEWCCLQRRPAAAEGCFDSMLDTPVHHHHDWAVEKPTRALDACQLSGCNHVQDGLRQGPDYVLISCAGRGATLCGARCSPTSEDIDLPGAAS